MQKVYMSEIIYIHDVWRSDQTDFYRKKTIRLNWENPLYLC